MAKQQWPAADTLWAFPPREQIDAVERCARAWMAPQWGPDAATPPTDREVEGALELVDRLRAADMVAPERGDPDYVDTPVFRVIAEFGGARAYDSRYRNVIANLAAEVVQLRAQIAGGRG